MSVPHTFAAATRTLTPALMLYCLLALPSDGIGAREEEKSREEITTHLEHMRAGQRGMMNIAPAALTWKV